jgi:1-deoxy-D-xylulose-5-phosphate reductoisomerase
MKKQRVALIGATGSVGQQSIDVFHRFSESFDPTLLCCHSDWQSLNLLAKPWPKATLACTKDKISALPQHYLCGSEEVIQAILEHPPDILLIASAGLTAFSILRECYQVCPRIAIANKETLLLAGCSGLLKQIQEKCLLMPVDSEHASIHSLLEGRSPQELRKVYLTASGGPFYSRASIDIDWDSITPEQALKHPSWHMGTKVTLDSATMANKGIELIEAYFLFSLKANQLDILIHPRSWIHAVAEWIDGTSTAHVAPPDMRLCVQYALTWPKRLASSYLPSFDWKNLTSLPFVPFDAKNLAVIQAAYESIEDPVDSRWLPLVYLALDEIALERFVQGSLSFKDLGPWILKTLRIAKEKFPIDSSAINPMHILGIYKEILDWIKKGC